MRMPRPTALSPLRTWLAGLAAGLLLPWLTAMAQGPASPENKTDFSPTERLLLMSDQLHMLKPPTTLSYGFRKTGSLEPAFTDSVTLKLQRLPSGQCCQASGDFLTGERRMALPDVEQAQGNPVILFFLERDIREMQRLTKGSTVYFRKRIRMALYEAAQVSEARYTYQGRPVAGQEIVITPYRDDPNRAKFEKFTGKQYVFALSNQVPGGVVGIRTRIPAAAGNDTLLEEELLLAQAMLPVQPLLQATAPPGKQP